MTAVKAKPMFEVMWNLAQDEADQDEARWEARNLHRRADDSYAAAREEAPA